jgi:thiol-disulfide isomerase/thioredoxin
MKRISLFLVVAFFGLTACGNGNQKAQFKGRLSKHLNTWIYLEQIQGAALVPIDSVKTSDKGEFSFIKKVPLRDFYRFRLSGNNTVFVILDPTEELVYMNTNDMLQQNYSLEGSVEGNLVLEIKALRQGIYSYRDSLVSILNSAAEADRAKVQAQVEQAFNLFVGESFTKARNIIRQNPDKLAPITAADLLDPDREFESYELLAENLKKNHPNSGYAQTFINRVKQMKLMAIGAQAPEINLPNPDGASIALSSLKGKVVLIDFWASWCGPCRKENPNVVRIYNQYKDKGFDIYSVSLDKDKNSWVKAIGQDGLTWKNHVSDLGYWNSSVVSQYGFTGIPFTVLIDKAGNIVAKGLRGPELEQRIASLLN